jgi:hypothetical protein
MAATFNSCQITNVTSGECIGLDRVIQVAYTNVPGTEGTIEVTCPGGVATPASAAAPNQSGTVTVDLTHAAPGGVHKIAAVLKHDGVRVTGDAVGVNVGNPCSIKVNGPAPGGVPQVDPTALITGKFDAAIGNQVVVLVEEQLVVSGTVIQPRLVFVGAADVLPAAGTWRHLAIPGAHPGQFLRAVLAKDGEIKSMVRAVFV